MCTTSEAPMNGQAAAGGAPTSSSGGSATSAPRKCTSAVSSSLSPLLLTSAFQLACSTAPTSTASTIGQVSVIDATRRARSFELLQVRLGGGQHGGANARGRQRAGRLEDRVGDRTDVRIDALQVADQVEVQRAGLDALRGVVLQPRDVAGCVLVLQVAEARLLLQQLACVAHVALEEHAHRQPQVGHQALVQ